MSEITVVVPVYNVESYLPKCIDSVLMQTEEDFKLILVDDGSTDSSPKICDEYAKKDKRIQVIHQENKGLGGARNTGIENCTTERIIFLDSDDTIEKDTIKVSLKKANQHDAEMLIFGFRSVTEEGETREIFLDDVEKDEVFNLKENKKAFSINPTACNKVYKTALFKETGIRYPNKVWYEDIRTTLKLMLHCERIVFTDDVFYNYLIRAGSITKNINADRNIEIIDAFDDIITYFKDEERFKEFYDELEFLAIFHIYIAASVRVIRIDRKHKLITRFKRYMVENFPDYKRNKYLGTLGRNKSLIFSLLEKKMYRTIGLIFKIKG